MDKATRAKLKAQAAATPIGNTQTIVTVPERKACPELDKAFTTLLGPNVKVVDVELANGPATIVCHPKNTIPESLAKRAADLPKRDRKLISRGRLPDGATFHAVYNAAKEQWTAQLDIGGDMHFEAVAGGVFKTMQMLDRQYRKSVDGAKQIS